MTKYTRREFFKSIIPVSVGVVSFLGGTTVTNTDELITWLYVKEDNRILWGKEGSVYSQQGGSIPYEVSLVGNRELTEDEIERGKELEDLALECLNGTSDLYFLKE